MRYPSASSLALTRARTVAKASWISLTSVRTQRRRILVFDDECTTGYQLNAVIGCLLDQAATGSTRNQPLAWATRAGLPRQFPQPAD